MFPPLSLQHNDGDGKLLIKKPLIIQFSFVIIIQSNDDDDVDVVVSGFTETKNFQ